MSKVTNLPMRVATLSSRVSAPSAVPSYGQGRGGRPWRTLRAEVMKRDGYLCQCEDCKGMRLLAHEVDHIIPVCEGGTDHPSNLRAINRDCHKAKTQAEARRAHSRDSL